MYLKQIANFAVENIELALLLKFNTASTCRVNKSSIKLRMLIEITLFDKQ